MGKPGVPPESATRQQLFAAALSCFSEHGYAATSVQEIVDAAKVSKPALYYYFKDKADLFQAVVDSAHDERFRLMQEAAARGRTVQEKLEIILGDIFEYSLRNRELMRLTFATAFAGANDAPIRCQCRQKGRRNFDYLVSLIQEGLASGEFTSEFTAEELAMGIYGQLNSYVMIRILAPDCPLDRTTAKRVLQLFLAGAANRSTGKRNGYVPANRVISLDSPQKNGSLS